MDMRPLGLTLGSLWIFFGGWGLGGTMLVLTLLSPIALGAQATDSRVHNSRHGSHIDKATAIKIAGQEWVRIYGKAKIESESPYQAVLKNGVWYVSGSLPNGRKGGVAEAEISAHDGRIIKIRHGK